MDDNQLYMMLGRIDGKLDHALQRQDKQDQQQEALEKRVSALERSKFWLVGAVTALSLVANYAKDIFLK